MNENNYRNQINLIYGAPRQVIAAGQNKRLIQASQPKRDNITKNIENLERILNFTRFPGEKDPVEEEKPVQQQQKRVTQAGFIGIEAIIILDKLLSLGQRE